MQDLINPGNSHSGILFIMHLSVAIAIAWGPLQMVKKLKLKLFSACILLRSMHAVLLGIQAMIQDTAHWAIHQHGVYKERICTISVWTCSSANNDKMLQTTLLYTCLFAVLNEVTTISPKDKITGSSNAIITAAMSKVIFNSTEMNHDTDTDLQPLCSYLAYHQSPL